MHMTPDIERRLLALETEVRSSRRRARSLRVGAASFAALVLVVGAVLVVLAVVAASVTSSDESGGTNTWRTGPLWAPAGGATANAIISATAGSARGRERVTYEIRLDPALDALEWVDHEPVPFATDSMWTIELPPVDDADLLLRRTQVGELVRPAADRLAHGRVIVRGRRRQIGRAHV